MWGCTWQMKKIIWMGDYLINLGDEGGSMVLKLRIKLFWKPNHLSNWISCAV